MSSNSNRHSETKKDINLPQEVLKSKAFSLSILMCDLEKHTGMLIKSSGDTRW